MRVTRENAFDVLKNVPSDNLFEKKALRHFLNLQIYSTENINKRKYLNTNPTLTIDHSISFD